MGRGWATLAACALLALYIEAAIGEGRLASRSRLALVSLFRARMPPAAIDRGYLWRA